VARALHAAERWQQRAGIYAKDPTADLLDAQRDAVAMHALKSERFQDKHFESSLHQIA
jgi:hypothetical protein